MSKRLNLLNTIEARSSSVGKDSLIVNGIAEVEDNVVSFVSKRPGLEVKAEGTGTANGALWYDNTIYYWDENTPNTAPLTATYSFIGGEYILGSLWVSGRAYSQNEPIAAIDPNDGLPKTFYPIGGTYDTGGGHILPEPDTTPNSVGSKVYGTTPNEDTFSSASAANTAATDFFNTSLTPTPGYPGFLGGEGYGDDKLKEGPADNPPTQNLSAYTVRRKIWFIDTLGAQTILAEVYVVFNY